MINTQPRINGTEALNRNNNVYFAVSVIALTKHVATFTDEVFERFGFFSDQITKRKIVACCLTGCLDIAILRGIRKLPLRASLLYSLAMIMPLTRYLLLTSNHVSRAIPTPDLEADEPLQLDLPESKSDLESEATNKKIVAAADINDPEGLYQAAFLFEYGGAGFAMDLDRSDYYYSKAADLGHALALKRRSRLFKLGTLCAATKDKSSETASFFFIRAARQGHHGAQYEIGCRLKHGQGAFLDTDKALAYFCLAQPYVEAAHNEIKQWPVKVDAQLKYHTALQLMVKDPEHRTNFWEIVQLLKCAGSSDSQSEDPSQGIRQKAVTALYNLGEMAFHRAENMYSQKDYMKALQCYEAAFHLSLGLASYKIGRMFELGKGVEINLDYALSHYYISGQHGCKEGKTAYERLVVAPGIHNPITTTEILPEDD